MSEAQFEAMLEMVLPHLMMQHSKYSDPVNPELHLAIL